MKVAKLLTAAVMALSMAAEAQFWWDEHPESANRYARTEALRMGSVTEGVVVSTRNVHLEPSAFADTTGKATGGALGVLAGSKFGKGNGRYASMILGGIMGAVVGQEISQFLSEDRANEVIVRLSDGSLKYVVQKDAYNFRPGDRVYLLEGGWNRPVRVVPAM